MADAPEQGSGGAPAPPGRLLARGRDADVYEFGRLLVVRRARDGRSLAGEAAVIEHVRRAGYPVPAVHDVRRGGSELVMDRVDGPSMMSVLLRRPWRQRAMAELLAELHRALGAVEAPPDLRPLPEGGRAVVHLDLHPLNVIMSRAGPMVIDWSNAARGLPAADVAQTWVILASSEAPAAPLVGRLVQARRHAFVERFLDRTGLRREAERLLPRTLADRLADRHVTEGERLGLQRWLASIRANGGDG